MNTVQTAQKRPRGRPRLVNPLTPAQRSKRYRERLRQRQSIRAATVIDMFFEEVASPADPVREQKWRNEMQAAFDRIDQEIKVADALLSSVNSQAVILRHSLRLKDLDGDLDELPELVVTELTQHEIAELHHLPDSDLSPASGLAEPSADCSGIIEELPLWSDAGVFLALVSSRK